MSFKHVLAVLLVLSIALSTAQAFTGCQQSYGCGISGYIKASDSGHVCYQDSGCTQLWPARTYTCTQDPYCSVLCNTPGTGYKGSVWDWYTCTLGSNDGGDHCLISAVISECVEPSQVTITPPEDLIINPGESVTFTAEIGPNSVEVPDFASLVDIWWLNSEACDSIKETVTINGHAYETAYNALSGACSAIITPEFAAQMSGSTLNIGGGITLAITVTTDHATPDPYQEIDVDTFTTPESEYNGGWLGNDYFGLDVQGEAPTCDPTAICDGECRGIGYSNDGGLTCYSSDTCSSECDARISFEDRYNTELATGATSSAPPNFTITADGITTNFYEAEYTGWEYYVFPLGRAVSQYDDFSGEFRIKTPVDFGSVIGHTAAGFGFTNGASSAPTGYAKDITNVLMTSIFSEAAWNQPPTAITTGTQAYLYDTNENNGPDGGSEEDTRGLIQADTIYIIKLSFEASTQIFTTKIYDLETGALVLTETVDVAHGTGNGQFSVDSIGFFTADYIAGGEGDIYDHPWTIYSVKANSDLTEKGQSVIPQSGISLQWASDDSDATKTSKVGLQNLNVLDGNGKVAAVLDLNLDNAPLDINFPEFTVAFDTTSYIALLHSNPDLATWELLYPGLVLDDSIYVPINPLYDITGVYHCPHATQPSEISTSCPDISYSIDKVQTTINGVNVAKIPNQGGGSGPGGSSIPEFSDFAWILAAGLGVGSFVLIRRFRK